MMPVVRISDDVFQRLQRHAEPLVDSISDVLTKVLNGFEKYQQLQGSQVTDPGSPEASAQTKIENYGDLWVEIAKAFNSLGSAHTVSEKPSTAYFKQIRVGLPSIHYEWAMRKRDQRLDVCLHFEADDRVTNQANLEEVLKHEADIRSGIALDFSGSAWGRAWAQLMFRIPYEGDFPARTTIVEAAETMKKLIERTWPLIEEMR